MGFFSMMGRLGLNTTDFQAGVKRVESATTGMARRVSSDVKGMIAGAFSIGAITSFTKSVINAGDRIGDLAEQYHLTTEEVQKMEILAGRTGFKFEKFGEALIKFADLRQKAIDGDEKSLTLLNRYGVTQEDVVSKSNTNLDLVTKLSTEYSKVSGSSQAQADALDIAGAKGQKVLSVLTQIKDLGPVKLFSEEDIKSMGEFNDNMDEVLRQMKVASGPTVGFWASVLKRGNELDRAGDKTALSDAYIETLMGWNPNTHLQGDERTDAITPEELAEAREKLKPYQSNKPADVNDLLGGAATPEDFEWLEWAGKNGKKEKRGSNPFIQSGDNLASQGFGYFGGNYNQQVLSELKQQVNELRRITAATTKTAEVMTQDQ